MQRGPGVEPEPDTTGPAEATDGSDAEAQEAPAKPKRRAARTARGSASSRSRSTSGARSKSSARGESKSSGRSSRSSSSRRGTGGNGRKPALEAGPKPRLQQRYLDEAAPALRQEFGYTNPMQAPKPLKIVLNIGLGEALQNSNALEAAAGDLATISGQRPVITRARKSIANYRLRAGMAIGATVTLRDARMWQFLDRLVNIALPRVRDFHGVSRNSFDGRGNYSLGFSEQIVFPEIDYNQIDRLRGLQVTIVTSAKTDEEGLRLLELLGMPYARVTDGSQVAAIPA